MILSQGETDVASWVQSGGVVEQLASYRFDVLMLHLPGTGNNSSSVFQSPVWETGGSSSVSGALWMSTAIHCFDIVLGETILLAEGTQLEGALGGEAVKWMIENKTPSYAIGFRISSTLSASMASYLSSTRYLVVSDGDAAGASDVYVSSSSSSNRRLDSTSSTSSTSAASGLDGLVSRMRVWIESNINLSAYTTSATEGSY